MKSVFAGKKGEITVSINQGLIDLIKETSETLGLSESDFVNGLLINYFEERGEYKTPSFCNGLDEQN